MTSSSIRFAALALGLSAFALSGCTADTPAPTTEQSASALLSPELAPQTLAGVDEPSATAESTRLADEIAGLIDPATVVSVLDESRLVPSDDDMAAYYVAYRTYVLVESVDPLTLADTIAAVLVQSGWTTSGTSEEGDLHIVALAGGTEEQPWFVFVQGDVTDGGRPAITIELASPDL